MNRFMLSRMLFRRSSAVALAALVAIRICQTTSINPADSGDGLFNAAACYSIVSGTNTAAFAIVPLFAFCSASALRNTFDALQCTRYASRESILYRFLAAALVQAFFFTAIVNATALIPLLSRCAHLFGAHDIALVTALNMALETVFFLVCSALMFAVFAATQRMVPAALALFGYAIWDYLIKHVPYHSDELPSIGWQAATVEYPVSLAAVSGKFLLLAAMLCALICLGLLCVRVRDFLSAQDETSRDA